MPAALLCHALSPLQMDMGRILYTVSQVFAHSDICLSVESFNPGFQLLSIYCDFLMLALKVLHILEHPA